jgi:integrase
MRIPELTFVYDRKGQATIDRKGVVELRISEGRDRKYISTGVKLYPKEWKNGSVVGRMDWKELNDMLQLMKRRCSEIIIKQMEEGKLEIASIPGLLKESMLQSQTFLEYARQVAESRYDRISPGTKEHYEHWFRFMGKWRGIVYFADVTESNVRKLDKKLRDMKLKECSRWSYHKILKTLVKKAVEDGLVKKNPYSRLDIKKGNEGGLSRYLTPEEFHRFERVEIPIERLDRVRDLFVFQTYTMMSYSDLEAFDYKKCETVNGSLVYKSNRLKTGQEFVVVILPQAQAILRKYKNKLPLLSNVKYNLYLKNAILYAKIDKLVTTHWARHTGATMLLNEGKIPMHVVQHILGHASIRETERTYAKVLDSTIVDSMSKFAGQ